MQIVNNVIFDSTLAADGTWRNISNFVALSVHVTNVEGNVWVEVSNDPNVMINGASISVPSAPTLTQFLYGGLKNQGTLFAKVTYVTTQGETTPSGESSLAVSDGNELVVASPAKDVGGYATGYNVYVGTLTNTEVKQNILPIPIGSNFVLSNGYFNSTVVVPISNLSGSPAAGINISGNMATFTAPTGVDEIQFFYDSSGKQVMMNPSCLAWNYLRVRKSNSAQTLETKAYLFGQNG